MLLLAILVISMFIGVAIGISFKNIWMILIMLVLGFAFMGFGISIKQKRTE